MDFKASSGKTVKIVTIAVTVLFAAIIIWNLIGYQYQSRTGLLLGSAVILLVYSSCWLYSPLHYSVDNDFLTIHRPIGNLKIKRDSVTNVQALTAKQISYAIRTFGVGGVFGYFGKFYNTEFGSMNWYLTRKDTPVLVTTSSNKKIVISPDDQTGFVRQFD